MIFSKTKTTIDPPDSTLVNDFSDTNHAPAAKRAIPDTMDFSGSGGGQASGLPGLQRGKLKITGLPGKSLPETMDFPMI